MIHNVMRPIMRYLGGKWRIAPWIIAHFPKHRTYIEPFGGGGSVLLRKSRAHCEIYNDLHGEVVNLFRVARDHGDELRRLISLTPYARDEFLLSYQVASDPVEQARRTVVRSYFGYGSDSVSRGWMSGFRHNTNQNRTVASQDWASFPDAFSGIIERLRGVVIENRDAREVMIPHDRPDTLFYIDPPYLPATRSRGGRYRHEMNEDDHIALAEFLRGLTGMVVLSGYDSLLYSELYSDWPVEKKAARDGSGNRRIECIWINPQAVMAVQGVFA